jgi:hypothetical protein
MSQRNRAGRNSPCPCGSGRKFKHCHERSARKAAKTAGGKASARLLELGGPLLDAPDLSDEEFLVRLKFVMSAWNIAVLEASASDTSEVRATLRAMDMESQLDDFVRAKIRMYPDDLRYLIDVIVTTQPDGERFAQVISST